MATTIKTTIHDLTEDVLRNIFAKIALGISSSTRTRKRTVLTCTAVCRRWRATTMGFGKIWAHIIDWERDSPSWIVELLKRSDPYPLDVGDWEQAETKYLHALKSPRGKAVFEALDSHISRLRLFAFYSTYSFHWERFTERLLTQPGPGLETLYLGITDFLDVFSLLNQNTPNLRSLSVIQNGFNYERDIPIPVNRSIERLRISSLVELKVKGLAVPIEKWIEILLVGLPNLRWLSLNRSLMPRESPHYPPTRAHSPAPKLEMLILDQPDLKLASEFIDVLVLSSKCGLQLTSRLNEAGLKVGSGNRELLSRLVLDRARCLPKGTPNRNLSIVDHSDQLRGFLKISNIVDYKQASCLASSDYWTSQHQMTGAKCDPVFEIDISCCEISSDAPETSFVPNLIKYFEATLSTTSRLHIGYVRESLQPMPDFAPFRLSFFSRLKNLWMITLFTEAAFYFLPALMKHSDTNDRSGKGMLLPRLRRMSFMLPHTYDKNEQARHVQVIYDFLNWRKANGYPIKRVEVDPCEVAQDLIREKIGSLCELKFVE